MVLKLHAVPEQSFQFHRRSGRANWTTSCTDFSDYFNKTMSKQLDRLKEKNSAAIACTTVGEPDGWQNATAQCCAKFGGYETAVQGTNNLKEG